MEDIRKLASLDDEYDFEIAADLVIKKWRNFAPKFTEYFVNEYFNG